MSLFTRSLTQATRSFARNRTLNKVMIIGRVGADPEIRQFESGHTKVSFPVCTDRRVKQGEEWVSKPEWHKIAFFNNQGLAQMVDNHLSKGSLVYVEGELRTQQWKTADDQYRQLTEIVIGNGGSLNILRKSAERMAQERTEREEAEHNE